MADSGGEASDRPDSEIDRSKEDVAEFRADISAMRADIHAMCDDTKYIRSRLDAMPTKIQLLGFIIAIFVASGLTRYFGH